MEARLRIGGHDVGLAFAGGKGSANSMELLPSMEGFVSEGGEGLLFHLYVDDGIRPAHGRKKLRDVDTGNGVTTVYCLEDDGYEFVIKDIYGRSCCLLQADKDFEDCRCALNGDWQMRNFGLNDAMMLAYAFAGSRRKTLLMHAACVRWGGRAYPFVAGSGTGKSTHASLWMRHVEGVDLLNDDNPVVRIEAGGDVVVYGSPWSGKTPCYRDVRAPLGAVTRIERDKANSIERLSPARALASLLTTCSTMRWDSGIYGRMCDMLGDIISKVPVYTLHCLPDEDAALLCHHTITASL